MKLPEGGFVRMGVTSSCILSKTILRDQATSASQIAVKIRSRKREEGRRRVEKITDLAVSTGLTRLEDVMGAFSTMIFVAKGSAQLDFESSTSKMKVQSRRVRREKRLPLSPRPLFVTAVVVAKGFQVFSSAFSLGPS